jgi:hypothetical protein
MKYAKIIKATYMVALFGLAIWKNDAREYEPDEFDSSLPHKFTNHQEIVDEVNRYKKGGVSYLFMDRSQQISDDIQGKKRKDKFGHLVQLRLNQLGRGYITNLDSGELYCESRHPEHIVKFQTTNLKQNDPY